jgi:hypothetical protein
MRLSQRLQRPEKARPPSGARLWLVCVDDDGRILDDGSQETLPWIGMHYGDVPGGVGKIIVGIDPLAVLGREPAAKCGGRTGEGLHSTN